MSKDEDIHRCIRSVTGDKIKMTGVDGEVYEGPESECPFCHPDFEAIAEKIQQGCAASIDDLTDDLDSLVHDLISQRASTINNGGLEEQVRFLFKAGAIVDVEEIVKKHGGPECLL